METKNSNSALIRKSILICVIMLSTITPAFSQTKSLLLIPIFDLELIAAVLAVVALATIMFVAMIKYKRNENKEFRDTRNDRSRANSMHHGSRAHRRHTNMGHFKY